MIMLINFFSKRVSNRNLILTGISIEQEKQSLVITNIDLDLEINIMIDL